MKDAASVQWVSVRHPAAFRHRRIPIGELQWAMPWQDLGCSHRFAVDMSPCGVRIPMLEGFSWLVRILRVAFGGAWTPVSSALVEAWESTTVRSLVFEAVHFQWLDARHLG